MKFTESLLFKLVAIACCIIIALITIFGVVACCMIKDQLFVNSVKLSDNGELVVVYSDGSTNTFVIPTQIGENGKSAYELYLETVPEEETPMTVDEWLESLKGQNGDSCAGGVGILTAVINENGELVLTMTDGSELNLGVVVGKDGTDGIDGLTPYIGENGNWFIGDTDTGVKASGADGKTPVIEINEDGYWVINGEVTKVSANGYAGVGIASAMINENGELVLTMTDGTELNVGEVVGENGAQGVGIESISLSSDKNTLIIVLTDFSVIEIPMSETIE